MNSMTKTKAADPKVMVAMAETAQSDLKNIRQTIAKQIFGQELVVERSLVTILSGGHALLVGVPGLAKTKLVETLGTVLGLNERRVQFTPDLMPSDIIGSEVMDQSADGKRSWSADAKVPAADGRQLMEDLGFILTTYLVAFGAAGLMAWRVIRRGRQLSRQVPSKYQPWT